MEPPAFAGVLATPQASPAPDRGKPLAFGICHDAQMIFHGPVLYIDDALDFLKSHETELLYWMYPLFVKDTQYRAQREYRFVVHCEKPVEEPHLDLRISGMMRDSLGGRLRKRAK